MYALHHRVRAAVAAVGFFVLPVLELVVGAARFHPGVSVNNKRARTMPATAHTRKGIRVFHRPDGVTPMDGGEEVGCVMEGGRLAADVVGRSGAPSPGRVGRAGRAAGPLVGGSGAEVRGWLGRAVGVGRGTACDAANTEAVMLAAPA
jgi:hypothetical protein